MHPRTQLVTSHFYSVQFMTMQISKRKDGYHVRPNWLTFMDKGCCNSVENLGVMVDRFKHKILLADKVAKCSEEILVSFVVGIDLGVPALQEAQKNFLDWMVQTKRRIGDFRTSAL